MIEGKTILITGATGQLAGAIARGLADSNEVIALARFSAPGSREALEAAGVHTAYGDFVTRDFSQAPASVDYVVHAAANTRPKDSDQAMRDNVEGVGFLMAHYRSARGFLHVSATGCYAENPDRHHRFREEDPIGGATHFSPLYGVSKTAGEGLVRTLCQLYDLPTVIGRMNVGYGGPYADGGLPGRQLDAILAGDPIRLPPKSLPTFQAPIHEDDITAHVPILLEAASVPATIVNWGGDEGVEIESWVRLLGELVGREPNIVYEESSQWGSWIGDHSRRIALGCTCAVPWREGMRRMIAARHPEVKIRDVA